MFNRDELNQFYRYCFSLTMDESTAYDLLQNSLEKFLQNKTVKSNEKAFMHRIIRNQFFDDYRKQNNHQCELFEDNDYLDIDVKTLESVIVDSDLIEHMLLILAPLEREILYYWAVEGYSTQQIADMLIMPKGTVLSKIHRMRLKIKQQFHPESELNNGFVNEEGK